MTEKTELFRLRYLFRPSYLAGRLSEINSVSDVFKRLGGVLIYIGYLVGGFFILIWHRIIGLYYAVRRHIILGGAKIYAFSFYGGKILRKTGEIFIALVYKLQFFGDIYRDIALKRGLDKLKFMRDVYINPATSVKQIEHKSLHALWLIHPLCNYKCPYCWLADGKEGYKKRTTDEYIQSWERFNQRYGPANIEIVGGEPFISSEFPDLLAALSVKNTICIVTNLSWDPKTIIGRIDPAKLSLVVSYHPDYEPSLERFIGKITELQSAGFFLSVSIVGWPPYLARIPSWLNDFYLKGINVTIAPFVGHWKGRSYPSAYTAFAKVAIKNINSEKYIFLHTRCEGFFNKSKTENRREKMETDFATAFQLANTSPKGKLCNAGVSYFKIFFDGEVRRCSLGECLGEFYSGNYSLLDKPASCPSDKCYCAGEIACLSEKTLI